MSTLTRRVILFFATGAGSGYIPLMPGTAGTVVGIAVFMFLSPLTLPLYIVTTLSFIFFSIWCAAIAEQLFKRKDPSPVVIDEIAGFLVTMTSFPARWLWVVSGFILFRLMDIAKPYPANRINDRVPGGYGIVLDDVLAGIYANLLLQVMRLVFF